MKRIGEFCDQAAGFFIDPLNEKFSPPVQSIAVFATLLIGIATLGIAQAVSALWRRLRHIEEKNETHALVYEQFKKVFGIKKFTEGKEAIPNAPSCTDEQGDAFFDKPCGILEGEEPPFKEPSPQFPVLHGRDAILEQPQVEREKPLSPILEVKQPNAILDEKILEEVQEPLPVLPSFIGNQALASQLMNDKPNLLHAEEKDGQEAASFIDQRVSIEKLSPVKAEPKEEPKADSFSLSDECVDRASVEVLDEEALLLDKDELLPVQPSQESPTDERIKIYKESSSYHQSISYDFIFIEVIKKGIKIIPEFHLEKLSQAIENGLREKGKIELLLGFIRENDLQRDPGIDSGGLSRDYLDDLLEGLIQSNNILAFKTLKGSSLSLPEVMMKDDNFQPLPKLNEKEHQLYHSLGILMMFCYQSMSKNDSKNYLLGRRFDEGLFKAALSLTSEEINAPFEQLALHAKLKMCQALLDAHFEVGRDFGYLQKRLNWVSHFDQLNDEALFEAVCSVHSSEFLPPDYTINNQGEDPDMDKIKLNREEFKKILIASLFSQKGSHGQFGPQLAPIHAIAQGMKSICHPGAFPKIDDNDHWNAVIRQIAYQEFSNGIQGLLDRQDIAARIKLGFLSGNANSEIGKKIKWLQDWIKDEIHGATEEELKKLLKFLTGASSIPKNKSIYVSAQCGTFYPVPIAHTCSLRMELAPVPSNYGSYNDHTEANFIKSLKTFALSGSFGFQIT